MTWRPVSEANDVIRAEAERWEPRPGSLRYELRYVYDFDERRGWLVVFTVAHASVTAPKLFFLLPEPEDRAAYKQERMRQKRERERKEPGEGQ